MYQPFELAIPIRKKLSDLVKSLSIEQLNEIPEGLNNNLAWHLGHIVVSAEILSYHRTGALPEKEIQLADKYRNGTKPEAFIDQEEIDFLVSRLLPSLEEIEAEYKDGNLSTITPYTTHTFGTELTKIEEVFACCSHHDLLHCGNMMIMRKLIS